MKRHNILNRILRVSVLSFVALGVYACSEEHVSMVQSHVMCGDAFCGETEACRDGTCVEKSRICGNEVCGDTEVCKMRRCVDKSRICGNAVCGFMEECRNGTCKVEDVGYVVDLDVSRATLTPDVLTTTLSVSLSKPPESDVIVSLATSSPVITLGKQHLTFTPDNWNTTQTITVSVDASLASQVATTATITGTASGSDEYQGKSDTVSLTYQSLKTIIGHTTKSGAVTSCSESLTLLPGRYRLQAWGASGGDDVNNDQSLSSHGGLGGYAEGILTLSSRTTVYMHYGTKGYKGIYGKRGATAVGHGCNGGGGATCLEYEHTSCGFGGGGASDVRIGGDSLYHRVLVAGGGGGADDYSAESDECVNCWNDGTAGAGGGAKGIRGTENGVANIIAAGTQKTGYAFGQGGTPGINQDLGGGGGGWYGGKAPQYISNAGGGGGSGFVFTSKSSDLPSEFALDSSFQLTDAKLYGGNETFPAVTSGSETGHKGNGYVKITFLE